MNHETEWSTLINRMREGIQQQEKQQAQKQQTGPWVTLLAVLMAILIRVGVLAAAIRGIHWALIRAFPATEIQPLIPWYLAALIAAAILFGKLGLSGIVNKT